MNRIYRRVWSVALQCWVVASELAARKGKAGQAASATCLTVLLSMLAPDAMATELTGQEDAQHEQAIQEWAVRAALGLPPADILSSRRAVAPFAGPTPVTQLALTTDTSYANSTVNGNHLVVLGSRSSLTGNFSVGYGNLITTRGDSIVAIGFNVKATNGGYNTAVGTNAIANGVGATVYGNGAQAHSENSVAVGSGARTHDGAGIAKIAIGGDAYAGSSGWTGAIAMGGRSRAQYDGVAIGYEASTTANGTVALGRGSVASVANTVSVGNDTTKRRIVNVADGAVNAASTDVVNGRQLNAVSVDARTALSTANTAKSTADLALAATGLVTQASASSAIRVGGANTGTVVDVANRNGGKRRIQNIDNGVLSGTSTDAVTGSQLHATNTAVTTAQNIATSAQTTAVAAQRVADAVATRATTLEGLVSQTGAAGNVRLGAQNTGTTLDVRNKSNANRRISGVADATLSTTSTEAVTGKQLTATNTAVADARSAAAAAQAGAEAVLNRVNASALALGADAVAETNAFGISTALGQGARAYNGQSVALGFDARAGVDKDGNKVATANAGVSVGSKSRSGNGGVAMGLQAQAEGDRAVAVGNDAKSNALHASAIGYRSEASGEIASALGAYARASGQYATATGHNTRATGERALASGVNAQAIGASSSALGSGAMASHSNSVALGAGSVTASANAVSVGNASTQRKLQYVADGAVSAGSTDAVTGSQLHATNTSVSAAQNTATTAQTVATAAQQTADGLVTRATALEGLVSQVSASGNVRLGGQNTGTVLDVRNKSNAARKLSGVADGTLSATSAEAVTGKQLNATNTNVAAAQNTATTAQTTATAAQQTADGLVTRATALEGLVSQVSASGNVRLGAQNTGTVLDVRNKSNAARKLSGVADGTLSATSAEAVTGKQLTATNTNVATAQNTATTAQTTATAAQQTADGLVTRATALEGLVSQVSASGNVRLGGQNTGTTLDLRNKSNAARKLSGVADGSLSSTSSEAVTGRQLFTTQQKVTANEGVLATHSSQLSGQDGRIAGNRRDLDALRTEFDNFDPDLDGVVKFAADGSIDLSGGKVRGVAAGDISSAGGTEAVNGGQLFATNHRVSMMESAGRFVAVAFDEDSVSAKAGAFSVAIGDSAEAGEGTNGATAIGAYARAQAQGSVALGRASFVEKAAEDGFALGTGSTVRSKNGTALGGYSKVEIGAENSVALGVESTATEDNVVSVGNPTNTRRVVNVGRGRGAADASTIAQLDEALASFGGGAGVDGNGDIFNPTYTVQGGTQKTVGDALNALDSAVVKNDSRVGSIEHQLRSVFQEAPGIRSDGLDQLNLAGSNGMVLGNVANGLIAPGSRDAVNGGQLHAMEQRLDGRIDGLEQRVDTPPEGRAMATASAPTPPVTAEEESNGAVSGTPEAAAAGNGGGRIASADDGGKSAKADAPAPTPTPQVSTADLEKMLARASEYTDDAIKGVEQRLDKMDKRFNRLAAMNSAQSAMAMNTAGLATYNRLGAGVGYSDGESAMAVGYQRVLNEKGSATFSLNGAFTNSGEQSVGLGVGIGW